MNYIVCQEPGTFAALEKDTPFIEPGSALIKMDKVGVCGTDLHAFQGNQPFFSYPRILGHELAGTVLDANGSATIKNGDRVAIIPYLHCGKCIACRQGKTNCCQNLKVLGVHVDGGMQEQITLPSQYLIPANELSAEAVAIIEPLCIGAHAIRRASIKKGENVVVVGAGPIGLGIMRFAQLEGGRVIAVDINEERLAYAKEVMQVTDEVVLANSDAVDEVKN